MNVENRKLLVKLYYKNNESVETALKSYRTQMRIKRKSDGPTTEMLRKLIIKFEEYGTVHDSPKSGRPSYTEEDIEYVRNLFEEMKENGVRPTCANIAENCEMGMTTVWKILRIDLKMYPYKIQSGQKLTADHKIKRVNFCKHFLRNFFDEKQLFKQILYSDETNFSLSGVASRQNIRFGAMRNLVC